MIPERGNEIADAVAAESPLEMVPARDLWPVNDAAHRLGVTPRKVWTLLKAKRIKSVRLDGRRLIPSAALVEFINGLSDDDGAGAERGNKVLAA